MQKIEITNAGIQKVAAREVRALGNIEFGTIAVKDTTAKKLELDIFPKQLSLQGVTATVRLWGSVAGSVDISGFSGSKTIDFPTLTLSKQLPNLEIKRDLSTSDQLSLSLDQVGLGAITAALDPILGSTVGALVTGAIMEKVAADKIDVPVGGFQLEGLSVGSMALRDLAVGALHVGKATIGTVSGALPLPRLVMKNFKVPRTSSTDMTMTGGKIEIDFPEITDEKSNKWLKVKIKISGSLTLSYDKLSLPDAELEGSIGEIELRGLGVLVRARDLQLSPIEVEGTSIGAIALVEHATPVTSVSASPLFGGAGGAPFQDSTQDVKRLAQIMVRAAERIDSLQAIYEMKDGSLRPGSPHGGASGAPSSFTLNAGEHIVRMDGQYNGIVNRLRFHTDHGRVVSFGRYKDLYVEIDMDKIQVPVMGSQKIEVNLNIHKKIAVQPGHDISMQISSHPAVVDLRIKVPADVAPGSLLEVVLEVVLDVPGPVPAIRKEVRGQVRVKADHAFEFAAHEIVGFHGRSGAMLDAIGVLYV